MLLRDKYYEGRIHSNIKYTIWKVTQTQQDRKCIKFILDDLEKFLRQEENYKYIVIQHLIGMNLVFIWRIIKKLVEYI